MHIIWYNRTDELNAIIRFRDKDRGFRKNLQGKRNIFHVFLFTGVKADTLVQNAITNVLASTPIFNNLSHPYRSPAPMCLITDMNHERVNISVLTT